LNICTIIAKNYASHARVLAESFSRVHPDGACAVLVVDDYEGCMDPAAEPFELIGLEEIGLPDAERMAAAYDVTELSTAVKPWLLRHLLAREGVDAITYLDPDILVTDSLAAIDSLAAEHGTVLTPHFTAPLPRDGRKPSEEDILIAGTYNLGFISLADVAATGELLDWWSERLERHCVVDPANGLFVDQRWIDLVPGLWPGLHVLRDPGYNLAYWNLPTRRLEAAGEGYRVDGQPLRFFHFSGFDPTRPRALSKHQNRIEVASSPALSRICDEYAGALVAHGYEQTRSWSYGWDALPNGVRVDHAVRDVYREASADGAVNGIFDPRGAKRFVSYLNDAPKGGGVSRYARALRDSREDLLRAFPDVDGRDAAAFERWLVESAPSLGISPLLLPGGGEGETASPPVGEDASQNGVQSRLGVNLAGYLSSELGVGEAARQVAAALAARELPVAKIDVPVEEDELQPALAGLGEERFPFDVNLICANADMLPAIAAAAPPALLERRHTAGLWFWEVEQFPARWRDSFAHLDEVWTASEFVAEALRPDAPVPVRTIRIPVTPAEPGDTERSALSMPEGFCFLFVFDFRSVLRRKNPLGVVEAFARAFPPGSGASLMLKSVGADACPQQAAELAAAAAGHPDVHLFDGVVSAAAKNAMIAGCDCYVSLHRSEGLGLTMAEAMYFGKPVIATAYSGNLDFMSAENSFLVDYELQPIGSGAEPYPPAARWAEPSLEQAAELMRTVFEDRELAARVGARAAADIRASHSPEAAGNVLEERLEAIRRERVVERLHAPRSAPATTSAAPLPASPAAAAAAPPAIGDPASARGRLQYLMRFEQPPVREEAGPLRRGFKRLYMRLLRPFAAHQRRIDLSLRDAVVELGADLAAAERRLAAADASAGEELRGALADLDRRLQGLDADVRGAYAAQAEQLEAQVGQMDAQGKRQEAQGEQLAAQSEQLAAARSRLDELEPLSEQLERDRSFVDALRARVDRLAAETEGTLGDLREGAEEAGRLARAGAAKPYMADERFATREHPALGSVLGFEARAANGLAPGYRGFEDLFRGPEQMIRERQHVYLPLLGDGPVLDAGCGRGEFLDLLREAGIEGRGVDLDPGMVERCREKGHEVEQGDLLETLAAAAPASLGTIFCAQVAEHLEPEQLQRLLALSAERLRPGGKLIVETVNPHSAAALKAFWVDPTHRSPLFPETLLALCQLSGFAAADAFCPLGEGEWETDRLSEGEYAVLATAPSANGDG